MGKSGIFNKQYWDNYIAIWNKDVFRSILNNIYVNKPELKCKKIKPCKYLKKIWMNYSVTYDSKSICDIVMKEETDRTGSILKAGLHLGQDCGL